MFSKAVMFCKGKIRGVRSPTVRIVVELESNEMSLNKRE